MYIYPLISIVLLTTLIIKKKTNKIYNKYNKINKIIIIINFTIIYQIKVCTISPINQLTIIGYYFKIVIYYSI